MKITKSQLKQIIKEEIERSLKEDDREESSVPGYSPEQQLQAMVDLEYEPYDRLYELLQSGLPLSKEEFKGQIEGMGLSVVSKEELEPSEEERADYPPEGPEGPLRRVFSGDTGASLAV